MTKTDFAKDFGSVFFAAISLSNLNLVLNVVSVSLVILFTVPGIVLRWRKVLGERQTQRCLNENCRKRKMPDDENDS